MADQSDVEVELVDLITQTIYPDGTLSPSIVAAGVTLVDIRRGWPLPTALDIALASGSDVLVRVYPEPGMTRNTSRFVLEWRDMVHVPATLTASVTGTVVTFGGTGDASHIAGVMIGGPPYGRIFGYRLKDGDGPTEVADALRVLIGGSTSTSSGILTLVTNQSVIARVVNDQQAFLETRRQDQGFRVSIWSANNVARDAVAAAIDNATAALTDATGNLTMFLPLADGTVGWLRYRSTYNLDSAEKAGLYRRDLCYLIEYPTGLTQTVAEMLFGVATLAVDNDSPDITPQTLRGVAINLNS